MKIIIFDIDGVVIKSDGSKDDIIKNILQKHNLYDIKGVKEILELGLNRILVLEMISELISFDKNLVLDDINSENAIIESNPIPNNNIIDFIKNNTKNYILCTNTALPIAGLKRVVKTLNLKNNFRDLLAFENGSKTENVDFVINKYNINPKEILFIDDNINHINKVKETGVNTLHFNDYKIDIEKYIIQLDSKFKNKLL